jgi:hypothetical protein
MNTCRDLDCRRQPHRDSPYCVDHLDRLVLAAYAVERPVRTPVDRLSIAELPAMPRNRVPTDPPSSASPVARSPRAAKSRRAAGRPFATLARGQAS